VRPTCATRVVRRVLKARIQTLNIKYLVTCNENQDAGCQRQECDHDAWQGKVKERRDSDKNQIDREKEHSEVFGDVHGLVLRQGHHVRTLLIAGC
jgi:hypothetical protein